jgi:hypothetical protein
MSHGFLDLRTTSASGSHLKDQCLYHHTAPKLTITVIWMLSGFHVVTALPKRRKFNAGYSTREILQKIKNWQEPQRVGSAGKLNVHADNE